MTTIKNTCWNYAKPAAKQIWAYSLTSLLLLGFIVSNQHVIASDAQLAFEGHWVFDKDASDSHKKIQRNLEKQLAIQKSFQYPQKQKNKNTKQKTESQAALINAPEFLFSEKDIQLQQVDKSVLLSQAGMKRKVHLHSNSKSFSLKQFNSNTLTAVGSIQDGKLFIDSTTSGGLFIGETFYVDDKKRLIQQLRINDGIHPSLYLQRVYQACANACNKK